MITVRMCDPNAPTERITRRPPTTQRRGGCLREQLPDVCAWPDLRACWPLPRPRTAPWEVLVQTAELLESLP